MLKKLLFLIGILIIFIVLSTATNAAVSKINIDFGYQGVGHGDDIPGWNHIGGGPMGTDGSTIPNMVDSSNEATAVGLTMVDAFKLGRNGDAGTTTSTAFTPANSYATQYNGYIYEGDADHSVAIRIGGLNPSLTYNFGFFDSYMADNDARRECKYIIGSQSVNLVPNYNVNNVAYINDVSPDANGNVVVLLDFGAAPEVADKVCGLAVMTVEGDFTPSAKVNIDFGYQGAGGVAGWNNIMGAQAGADGFTLQGLLDSQSKATAISLKIIDGFYSIRNGVAGTTTSTAFRPVDPNATKNNMYMYEGDADHSVSFRIEGLDSGKTYKFGFFDSYMSDNDARRECKYVIGSQSVNLMPNHNVNTVVYINNVVPDANGHVLISLDFGAAPEVSDKVCGLAVMTIEGDLPYVKTYSRKINIDLGVAGATYAGWNNYVAKIALTDYGREHLGYLDKLVDVNDVTTNIAIRLMDDFYSAGSAGTFESTAFYPDNPDATQYDNYIYESASDPSGRTGSVRLENLDPNETYRFGFFDSYMSDNDARRECKYVIGSQSVNLMPNHNVNTVVYINNVVPDANGYVLVELTYGAPSSVANRIAGIAVMTIDGDNFDKEFIPTECGDAGTVYLDEDINQDCRVNLGDLAALAEYWMSICLPSSGWCDGTDLDFSTQVNLLDLERVVNEWLSCTDPADSNCDVFWQ